MNKKRSILITVIILSSIIYLVYSNVGHRWRRYIKTDDPNNINIAVGLALSSNDYSAFERLFMDKNKISHKEFSRLMNLSTSGTTSGNYLVIKNSNNEVFLIEITPTPFNGEYKIINFTVVPDEMKKLFN